MFEKQKKFIENLLPFDNMSGLLLAGGALTSAFTKSEVNDLDLYCKNEDVLIGSILTLVGDFYFPIHVSNKAITFVKGESKVQIIHYRFFENAEDVFTDFDFSVNMAAYDGDTREIIVTDSFLTSLASREVEFNRGTKYPLISLVRTAKYKEKGYKFDTSEMLKLGLSVSKLNIESWEDLVNQLGGVYGNFEIKDNNKDLPFSIDYFLENFNDFINYEVNTEIEYLSREEFSKKSGITDRNLLDKMESEGIFLDDPFDFPF